MERKAPLAVSAALVATLGLGIGGFATVSLAAETGSEGSSSGSLLAGIAAQLGAEADAIEDQALSAEGAAESTSTSGGLLSGMGISSSSDEAGATDKADTTDESDAADEADAAGTKASAGGTARDAAIAAGTAAAEDAGEEAPLELSDNPFAMQFQLDGKVFQLPCKLSDLERAGFSLAKDEAGDVLEDGYSTTTTLYYGDPDDYVYITCSLYNASGTELPFEECAVDMVSLTAYGLEGHEVVLPGGISIGASSQADIEAVYGPAEDPFVDGDYVAFSYERDDSPLTHIDFTVVGDVLSDVTLRCDDDYTWDAAAQKNATDAAVSSGASSSDAANAPALEAAPAPSELSDDPFSFQALVDDTVVQLPCPVANFEELGFTFEGDEATDVLEDGYQTTVSLYSGDPDDYIYVTATIYNSSGSEQTFENCMVSSVSFHAGSIGDHTVQISGGLALGAATPDEALAVFGEPAFDWTSDDGTARSFDFNPTPDEYYKTVSLWFDDGVLTDITLSTVEE